MARPRTPTNVLELSGAYKNHPERRAERENEPEPKAGIGPPPSRFTPSEAEAWDYLVGIAPIGVLGDSDRAHLELAARLLSYSWHCSMEKIEAAKLTKLAQLLGQMGLNPSDRSKVKVGGKANKPARGNAFSALDP
jgi:hypothetical protein